MVSLPARAETGEPEAAEHLACLAWDAATAAGCPTQRQMESAVEEILGRRIFLRQSCDIKVSGGLRPSSAGVWEAKLRFAKKDGTALGDRELQSQDPSCAGLLNPVSLVIALMVEANEAQATLHVPTFNPPEPSPSRANVAFAELGASWGLLPGLSLGPTVGFGAELGGRVPFRLDSTFWIPSSAEQGGRGGRFWAWYAGASLCPALLDTATAHGTVCAGIRAGTLRGSGVGLGDSDSTNKPYGHVEARAIFSFPLTGPLAGSVYLGAAVPWVRPRFVYLDDSGSSVEVHQPRALVIFGGLGFELRGSQQARGGASSQ